MTTATIPIQTSSFSYVNLIPCYQRFQWLNAKIVRVTLERFLSPGQRGRKGYDKVQMFQWLMYKQLMGCSYRDLESMTGIDYSTFIKFRKRLSITNWFKKVFNALVVDMIAKKKVFGQPITFIIDSSFVESYSKGKSQEKGAEYSGYKKKTGFKLHQGIDFNTRLPLKIRATGGARSDVVWGRELIRGSPRDWPVEAVLADRAYDAEDFVLGIKRKWKDVRVGIPFRMMRQQILTDEGYKLTKSINRCLDQELINKRTEIERYFSRKKYVFNLGEERTRHLKNFRDNCHMTAIMEILEWLSKDEIWWALFTRLGNEKAPGGAFEYKPIVILTT